MARNDVFSALSGKSETKNVSAVSNLSEMFGLTVNVRMAVLPISQLREKSNHPFKVVEDAKFNALAESIRENGLMQPVIVRQQSSSVYEILSGHRRTRACRMNGETKIKALVVQADDELANRIMIATNFQQRDSQLPSEIAKSYLIRYTDLKNRRKQQSENSNGWNSDEKIDKIMEKEFTTSKSKVYMYLRINHLIPNLLDALDNKKLNIRTATELSYLPDSEQSRIYDFVYTQQLYKLDLKKAAELKRRSAESELDENGIHDILSSGEKFGGVDFFSKSELRKYLSKFDSYAEMKNTVIRFLEEY